MYAFAVTFLEYAKWVEKPSEGVSALAPRTSMTSEAPRKALVAQACDQIVRCVEYHRKSKHIQAGMVLGIVTEDGLAFSKGWGVTDVFAKLEDQVPVTPDHVFRIGSISKLFTDIAVMRLVEAGKVDLDVPVATYIPTFNPKSIYKDPITLRNLMSHHSGLPREPFKGNYVDVEETTLEATIDSLNRMSLVFAPNTKYKYSNAGIGLVGRVLEVVTGEKFSDHVQKIFDQLEMTKTSFVPQPQLMDDLCHGYMWSYEDVREQVAPMFELGEAPAGTMFSTVPDLANFVQMLANGGSFKGQQIISPATLQEMWRQQFPDVPMGLGFVSMMKHGVRMVGHGGAIYGYSAELVVVPDLKLGFISMLGLDACNPVLNHVTTVGVHALLPVFKDGTTFVPSASHVLNDTPDIPIPADLRKDFEGLYVLESRLDNRLKMSRDDTVANSERGPDPHLIWIYFFATSKHLQVFHNKSRINLRTIPHQVPQHKISIGMSVIRVTPDDRLLCGQEDSLFYDIFYETLTHRVDHISFMGKTYKRSVETSLTPKASRRNLLKSEAEQRELRALVGEYGPPHNPTFVFIREKQLVIQVEWFSLSIVEKVGPNEYKFDEDDLYSYESVKFERDESLGPDAPATAIIMCDHLRYPRVAPRTYSTFEFD